jgi:hypothetical protein
MAEPVHRAEIEREDVRRTGGDAQLATLAPFGRDE